MQMNAGEHILTRGLPKTGQTEIYITGDDGAYQAGWWQGVKEARTRFIAKTLGDDDDDVAIDLATGLMWAVDGDKEGCNGGLSRLLGMQINHCVGLTFAGFSDWRVPNIKELLSLINYSLVSPMIDQPPFVGTKIANYWSSTSHPTATDWGYSVSFHKGSVFYESKVTANYLRAVRGGV